jgi:hypothetical protein
VIYRAFPRTQVPNRAWNDFVQAHEAGWFLHTTTWLDYALAYTPGAVDRSEALVDVATDRLVAICPLVHDGAQRPCYGGQWSVPPLGVPGLVDIQIGGPIAAVFAHRPGTDPCYNPSPGWFEQTHHTFVVDLQAPEKTLWRALRKSYRTVIRRAEQRYQTTVISAAPPEAAWAHLEQARALHQASAGRQTRPELTWRIQADWITAGYGVLALAHTLTGTPVGFAYALRYKDWAYYFSGASTEDDVQHLLQWRLMTTLDRDGATCHYELGHDAAPTDDEKTRNVAFFKSGFGGARVPVVTVAPV